MARHNKTGAASLYEHRTEPILSRGQFTLRLIVHASIAGTLLAASLGIGVLGYHYWGELDWVDSLLNASMILGGMGPVNVLETRSAKLFASFYALFSGVVFLGVAGIVIAPIAHRILHYLHLEDMSN